MSDVDNATEFARSGESADCVMHLSLWRNVPNTFKIEKKKSVVLQNKSEDSAARFGYEEVKTCFNEAEELTDFDVNSSTQKFNGELLTTGECEENYCYW